MKRDLDIERVVDLVTTEKGIMYYVGKGPEVYQLDLYSLKTKSKRYTILGHIKQEKDDSKLSIICKKIICKFNHLLNVSLFEGFLEIR